jgi:acetyl esterase/lipase
VDECRLGRAHPVEVGVECVAPVAARVTPCPLSTLDAVGQPMGTLKLWSDELDAMRPEARAVVAAQIGLLPDFRNDGRRTLAEQVARDRAACEQGYLPVAEAVEQTIAGVRCRVFRPSKPARAVYLHFHGGGMTAGAPVMMDFQNRGLSRDHDLVVVSVGYRRAPEHPWPAGPDDGVAVAGWLLEHARSEFGTSRLLIGGESAGAYLTAAVALRIRDDLDAIDRVAGLNLINGVFDWGASPSARGLRPDDGPDILDPAATFLMNECFLPGMTDDERRAPHISPGYADLHALPPCFLTTGTCDHCIDDTLLFATRATAAGVEVELFVAPDMPHAFMIFDCAMTRRWIETQAAWLEARLTQPAR